MVQKLEPEMGPVQVRVLVPELEPEMGPVRVRTLVLVQGPVKGLCLLACLNVGISYCSTQIYVEFDDESSTQCSAILVYKKKTM